MQKDAHIRLPLQLSPVCSAGRRQDRVMSDHIDKPAWGPGTRRHAGDCLARAGNSTASLSIEAGMSGSFAKRDFV